MLTQGRLKQLFHYSPDSGEFVRKTSPNNRVKAGDVAGYVQQETRNLSYVRIEIDKRSYRAHQLAFLFMTGEMPEFVDHIDGNGLNNSWPNLRAVTRSENMKNLTLRCDNRSGLMGVHFVRRFGKWQARINANGKRLSLGYFEDFFDAACARKSAEKGSQYHANHGRKAA